MTVKRDLANHLRFHRSLQILYKFWGYPNLRSLVWKRPVINLALICSEMWPEILKNYDTRKKTGHLKNSKVPRKSKKIWYLEKTGHLKNSRVPGNSRNSWLSKQNGTFEKFAGTRRFQKIMTIYKNKAKHCWLLKYISTPNVNLQVWVFKLMASMLNYWMYWINWKLAIQAPPGTSGKIKSAIKGIKSAIKGAKVGLLNFLMNQNLSLGYEDSCSDVKNN